MELVVDSNVVISALISSKGKTRRMIFSDEFSLFAPEFLMKEILNHKKEIMKKSVLSEEELTLALNLICSEIKFFTFEEFKNFIAEAE